MRVFVAQLLLAATALSGCTETADKVAVFEHETDPVVVAAINDPLLTDPDLATLNEANSLLTSSAGSGMLPTEIGSPIIVARAREETNALMTKSGGVHPVLEIEEKGAVADGPKGKLLDVGERAARAGEAACMRSASYTTLWAAKMPENMPIYPRAAVQDAVGSDSDDCHLRSIFFKTPVTPKELLTFYYSHGINGGFVVERRHEGGEDILRGEKASGSFTLFLRQRGDRGAAEAVLVTNIKDY